MPTVGGVVYNWGMKRRTFFRSIFGGFLAACGVQCLPKEATSVVPVFWPPDNQTLAMVGEAICAGDAVGFKGGVLYASHSFGPGGDFVFENEDTLKTEITWKVQYPRTLL